MGDEVSVLSPVAALNTFSDIKLAEIGVDAFSIASTGRFVGVVSGV